VIPALEAAGDSTMMGRIEVFATAVLADFCTNS
jgi:hypothetical protein